VGVYVSSANDGLENRYFKVALSINDKKGKQIKVLAVSKGEIYYFPINFSLKIDDSNNVIFVGKCVTII